MNHLLTNKTGESNSAVANKLQEMTKQAVEESGWCVNLNIFRIIPWVNIGNRAFY